MTELAEIVDVIKLDARGREVIRYPGRILARTREAITLEAIFQREDMHFHGILLGKGDRFVETFYSRRWYNVFEIHAREDDHVRGWYCNIGRPAVLGAGTVAYEDLALDLLVFPDGRQLVLDEDEFAALDLSPAERSQALQSMQSLQADFRRQLGEGQTAG